RLANSVCSYDALLQTAVARQLLQKRPVQPDSGDGLTQELIRCFIAHLLASHDRRSAVYQREAGSRWLGAVCGRKVAGRTLSIAVTEKQQIQPALLPKRLQIKAKSIVGAAAGV